MNQLDSTRAGRRIRRATGCALPRRLDGRDRRGALDERRRPRRAGSPTPAQRLPNAVDRHVAAAAAVPTRAHLRQRDDRATAGHQLSRAARRVAPLAGALRRLGVERGDRVVIYMPMVPEAVFAMLACARLGAIHSVVFGGFAAPELAGPHRRRAAEGGLAASCGLEPGHRGRLQAAARSRAGARDRRPAHCVVLQRPQHPAPLGAGATSTWNEAMRDRAPGRPVAGRRHRSALHPLYLRHHRPSQGRGARHRRLPRRLKSVDDQRLRRAAGRDLFWAASDIGWVVGHSWHIVYGPLVHGCTTTIYEGKPVGTPDAGAYWRICARHTAWCCSPRRPRSARSSARIRAAS